MRAAPCVEPGAGDQRRSSKNLDTRTGFSPTGEKAHVADRRRRLDRPISRRPDFVRRTNTMRLEARANVSWPEATNTRAAVLAARDFEDVCR
jgi:hypothetical protein